MDYAGWYGEYYGDNVAVSQHFRDKYPNFLDLFIHYSPIEYNHITLTDLDIENQKAIFEVDSILECKKRTYEVYYLLDDDMYLDDVKVNLLSEEKAELDKADKQSAYYIYRNSNWSKLLISNRFTKKFNSIDGVFYPLVIQSYKTDYIMKNNEYIYLYEFFR